MIPRRLVLLRHAKSAWDTEAPTDHDRPLNRRGRRDAPRIGAHLAALGWAPQIALCSDAARTVETWSLLGLDAPVRLLPGLYHGGPRQIAAEVELMRPNVTTAMIIGHNPGMETALLSLAGVSERMTTGNAALLVGGGASWAAALQRRWRLEALIRPRELTPPPA